MPQPLEQPNTPQNRKNLDVEKILTSARYQPGEYRTKISIDIARADIEKNFPQFKLEDIEYLDEGIGNIVFLVNKVFIFRFAKNGKASLSIEKEIGALSEIRKRVDLPVPVFEYIGRQNNQLLIVGYKKIEGDNLAKSDFVDPTRKVDEEIARQLVTFFQQLSSIDVVIAKQWGLQEQNFYSIYENELKDARDYVYPLLGELYPNDALRIKEYIEQLFLGYLGDEANFSYKSGVLHGDLEAGHIMFDKRLRKITGIIDWGGVRIGDPDYDIWRPYSHYGQEFIDEFLKQYSCFSPERLCRKLDFFFRAQMVHRTVRAIMVRDQKQARWHSARLRKQALGLGYWYHELGD